MSTAELKKAKEPKTIYLKDYKEPAFLIETVDLTFDLGEEITEVKSKLKIKRNPKNPQKNLNLNGEELILKSISLDGTPLSDDRYHVNAEGLQINNVGDEFVLDIVNTIKPQENTQLSGLYKSSGNFCTQCEAEGFRRITYFLDRPDVMACYKTTIIADKKLYPILLSNGNLIASGDAENNKHWATWEDPFKKPSYLFALVAGNFDSLTDEFKTQSGNVVELKIYVEKGNKTKCAHAMESVKKAMQWDEQNYGREYDLDIYMIVAVSDFNSGAMENKGLNIFNTKYILACPETATDLDYIHVESVIGHEYFHNWTGNRITCRDWFQLSLKEGLTIFRDQSFTADTTSPTYARIQDVSDLLNAQFTEDASPLSHPVRPDSYIEINNFYTATVYNKGAETYRMLQTMLGKDLFKKGMELYFNRLDGHAATIEDFIKVMEDVSGKDLTQFSLWYSQPGTPKVVVTDEYDAAAQKYKIQFSQDFNKAMLIPIKMGLLNPQGDEIVNRILEINQFKQAYEFENVEEKPIPSLLRDFSAPIKIKYDYTPEQFQFLFEHDTDPFNRWDAGQKYAMHLLLALIHDYQQQQSLSIGADYFSTLRQVINTGMRDRLLLSEQLTLPSERLVAEQMQIVDVDAIHAAREFLLSQIAIHLKDLFKDLYAQNYMGGQKYIFNMENVGKRQLSNISLGYLMLLNDKEIQEKMALKQFKDSLTNNMTYTIAALRTLVNIQSPLRDEALNAFYSQWKEDALVVDKWLSIQAISKLPDTLERVKQLLKHSAFDIKNPNKVYSLIAAFSSQNQVRFHDLSGGGYQLLSDVVMQLNTINPMVAARIVKPLTVWKRYDKKRQALMKTQLERILNEPKLSKDLYEPVFKALQ